MSAADSPSRPPIGFDRRFTRADVDPYAALDWERRAAHIENWTDGSVAFHQDDVEFPRHWSQNAANIVAQKYFRGHLGTAEREHSLRQVIDRVVGTISSWGSAADYFADDTEFEAFVDELTHLLVDQRAAFNSPVWFNIGVPDTPQQSSACFILSVDDDMDDILEWYVEEGKIFKGGSGSGVNLSRIRASSEQLHGGGQPSGPVSFMRGADASAGTIKSGGKTRRAAKMVILDADHPDIDEFVWTKAKEEHKARALRAAGFDMSLDGADSFSIQYQNANNSVRVTDEFMEAVEADRDWDLVARTSGEVLATVSARQLFHDISTAAWECADPGLQYDTTINRWHTCPESGRISGSNPCFPGGARVHTDKGLIRFEDLVDRVNGGETFAVYTHDATAAEPREEVVVSRPEAIHLTGTNPIVRLEFSNGQVLRCTPNHAIWTDDSGWVAAAELSPEHRIRVLDLATPASMATHKLPVPTDDAFYRRKGDHAHPIVLPDAWTEPLAHYLGWLVGDGCMTTSNVATIYGAADEQEEILPAHQALLASINGGRVPVPSVQANGTRQLRIGRRAVKAFFEALGVAPVKAPFKSIPWSILEAPPEMQAAFLRGLFDADGCAVLNQRKSSYVGIGSASIELLRGTQQLLVALGVASSIYRTRDAVSRGAFGYQRKDGSHADYASSAMFDLRISGADISRFASTVGFGLERKASTLAEILDGWTRGPYRVDTTVRLASCAPDGFERTYNLTEPRNHSYVVDGVVVRNCSEYVHLDDSACNLSSLNLLRFLDDDDRFDIEGFRHAVRVMVAAQEMLVSNSHYPTERIGENAEAYRQLGLGYTNLGALLMSLGLPYDSDDGRALAATITALMTGEAYRTSALVAARLGAFAGYGPNAASTRNVLHMHRDALDDIAPSDSVPDELREAARQAWDDAIAVAEVHGVRNAQVTVLAPTGTISFMMDCDTTGIEPEFALVKRKQLVGGGALAMVNRTVPRALRRLGYAPSRIDAIVAHLESTGTIEGADELNPEHFDVFACSVGSNSISASGHVAMMAAAQPFLSGGISKTVNLPESATAEDIESLLIDAWRSGVKAVAVYRDNCKVAQPLSSGSASSAKSDTPAVPDAALQVPIRQRLPRSRRSRTFEFRVADCKGFVTVGEFDDGRPGEIFVRVSKQGSTLAGIMDAFAISLSHGLQYGVPLSAFVQAFVGMRFEPAGMTDDPELRIASSLIDYLFRRLAVDYLTTDERTALNIFTVDERTQPTLPGVFEATTTSSPGLDLIPEPRRVEPTPELSLDLGGPSGGLGLSKTDAPLCMDCGTIMVRAGSCYACQSCGSTSGCS